MGVTNSRNFSFYPIRDRFLGSTQLDIKKHKSGLSPIISQSNNRKSQIKLGTFNLKTNPLNPKMKVRYETVDY